METPRKLRNKIDYLVQRLKNRATAFKNIRKRERRLRGKVSGLLKSLGQQRLLTSQAEDLLDAYKGR
jgi:hypothetical protein